MDNEKQKVKVKEVIELGKKAIIDIGTSSKMIKYSEIQGDSFGNKCGFYYKNIEIEDSM